MSGIATAIVAGGVASSMIGSQGAKDAAGQEADAANNAAFYQNQQYNQTREDQAPYRAAGTDALSQIQKNMPSYNQPFTMGQFQEDPGYQFTLQQGQQAIQNSAAAQGHMLSSQQLGNASNYSQNMASNEFGNAFNRYQSQISNSYNRLASLAQIGQAGVANTTQAGMNASTNTTNAMIGAGNAAAAGTVGQANAISGGIGSIANGLSNYGMMSNLMPKTSGGYDPSGMPNIGGGAQFSQPQMGSEYGSGANLLASY